MIGTTIPPVMGGLEVYTFELARQLKNLGQRVFLIGYGHYKNQEFKKEENIDGVEVWRLPSAEKSIFNNKFFYFLKVFKKLKEINQKFPLDLIHANTVVPAGLGGFLFKIFQKKIPLVITAHGYEVLVRPRNFFFKLLAKITFKNTDLVIGVSREVAQAAQASGAAAEKTVNWSNPVDTRRFNSVISGQDIRRQYQIFDDEIVILSLRRLHPKTGVQYLVEAASEIVRNNSRVKFLIIGDGILKKSLIQRVGELELEGKFIFTGSIANDLIPKYIAAADLAVFPSLAEATSIACLEVMATGVPVVASDVGGLPEIIEGGYNGVLVKFPEMGSSYQDFGLSKEIVDNLSQAVLRLVSNAELRKKLGLAGQRKVQENFSWANYLVRLSRVYEKLINETA